MGSGAVGAGWAGWAGWGAGGGGALGVQPRRTKKKKGAYGEGRVVVMVGLAREHGSTGFCLEAKIHRIAPWWIVP
jgi:hypothetical protein